MKNTETLTKTAQQQVVLKPGFHAKQGSTVTLSIEPSGASFTPSEDYKVDQLTYDANGNIQSLRRNQSSSNGNRAMDDLTYHYNTEKPNQLQQVTDAVTASTNAGDITSQYSTENYEYNSIGQLVRNNAEGINYTYNASGLVTEVNTRYVSVQFYYNDRNQRVRKVVSRNGQRPVTTVYVRDAAGTPMAIYRNGTLVEHTVYGASRLGVYKRQGNATHKTSYELTDHLGNVRAVVSRANTSAITGTDYYPFGMPMPLRNSLSDYRYAYQGQEKDPETGKEAFELRLWDARIGRWLTTDPKHEFASPYLGMGNNPINLIDPDGGTTDDWYEVLDSDGNGTGEVVWFDGSYEIEGHEHLGFFHTQTDSFNNTTFYDGNTQSSYLNGVFQQSFLEPVTVTGFFHKNITNPVLFVSQTLVKSLVNGFQGALIALGEGLKGNDIEGMKIDASRTIFDSNRSLTFNNGKFIHRDPFSLGEEQFTEDLILDELSLGLNKFPGLKATGNGIIDFFATALRDYIIVEGIKEEMNSVHSK